MNNQELRKLIGGYATNTLTGSERKALFEAALDDQELFNALQDEQALKQLLADPASRQALRQAVEPLVNRSRPKRWIWSAAFATVAATVVVLFVAIHRHAPEPSARPVEIASTQEPAAAPKPPERTIVVPPPSRRPQAAATTAPAQPEPSNKVTVEAAPNAISGGALGGVIGRAPPAAGVAGFRPLLKESPLRYALFKSDANGLYNSIPSETQLKPGDLVRVNVSTAAPGYLSLDQLMPSGEWKRVYPELTQGRLVAANTDYTIPESAIVVGASAEKFRISLAPQAPAKQLAAASRDKTNAARAQVAQSAKEDAKEEAKDAEAPLTIEITIAPGRAP